jgi:hypothetical protein
MMAVVIVERSFPKPIEFVHLHKGMERARPCLALHGVRLLQSFLSPDRQRMICMYEAADAESVRIANRQAGTEFERAWTATVIDAAVPPASG